MKLSDVMEGTITEGTYVAVKYDKDDSESLYEYFKKLKVPDMLPASDYHTTVAFSKKKFKPDITDDTKHVPPVKLTSLDVFTSNGGARCLVVKVDSDWLVERFEDCMELGATYDYVKYKPHITISYDIGDLDIKEFEVPDLTLKIIKEYTEPLEIGKYDKPKKE